MDTANELSGLNHALARALLASSTEARDAGADVSVQADPLEGDTLPSRRRSEPPSAYSSIALVEGHRVLTVTPLRSSH